MVESLEDRSMLTAAYINIANSVNEGDTAVGAITLDEPSDDYVSVSWTTADGTAHVGSDYRGATLGRQKAASPKALTPPRQGESGR